MLKKISLQIIGVLMLCLILGSNAEAYRFNGWVLSNPSNVKCCLSTTIAPYASDTLTCIQQWTSRCSEIGTSVVSSNENVYFYGDLNVSTEAYAVTRHTRDDYHVIVYYKDLTTLNATQRKETIVHEFGHALGLAHCEESKNNVSVMRATGFNNKAYPLSDDISGISARY